MYYLNADGTVERVNNQQQRCNCNKCQQKYKKSGSSWFSLKNIILFIIVAVILYMIFTSDFCKRLIGTGKSPPPPPPLLRPSTSPPSPPPSTLNNEFELF